MVSIGVPSQACAEFPLNTLYPFRVRLTAKWVQQASSPILSLGARAEPRSNNLSRMTRTSSDSLSLPTGKCRSGRDTPQDAHRCGQPGQQHGRRIPSLSSEHTLSTCCRLVSSFLTEMVQQIHSLRASGVMSSQAASAFASDVSAFRRSAGRSCTTPPEIRTLVMVISRRLKEQVSDTRVELSLRDDRRQSGHYPLGEFCPENRRFRHNSKSSGATDDFPPTRTTNAILRLPVGRCRWHVGPFFAS
jgi:hypothetical protein